MHLQVLTVAVLGSIMATVCSGAADAGMLVDKVLSDMRKPLLSVKLPDQDVRCNKTILQYWPVWAEVRLRNGEVHGFDTGRRTGKPQVIGTDIVAPLIFPKIEFIYRGVSYFWDIPFANLEALTTYKNVAATLRISLKDRSAKVVEFYLQHLPNIESNVLETGFWAMANFIINYDLYYVNERINLHLQDVMLTTAQASLARLNATSAEYRGP